VAKRKLRLKAAKGARSALSITRKRHQISFMLRPVNRVKGQARNHQHPDGENNGDVQPTKIG
jgi:hypothetical protein